MQPLAVWRQTDLVKLAVAQLACVAAIVVAWATVAGRGVVSDQLLWLSVAVAASVASGLVNGVWLLRLRRAVAGRRVKLLGHLDAVAGDTLASRVVEGEEALVAIPGMDLVHRASCQLVAGKAVEPVAPNAVAGEPCGWCRP